MFEDQIRFNSIIKNPDNWVDGMDLDVMTENFIILRDIIPKMFFTEMPKHPELFVLLFSDENFPSSIFHALFKHDITIYDLQAIWFKEYSEEEKKKLLNLGVLEEKSNQLGVVTTLITANENNLFVNLFVTI